LYGEWVEEHVLEPVAHRQYVFAVPRLLRPVCGRHRAWLGELCRIAARLLVEATAEAAPGGRPGLILFVQTFGELANFDPHVHVLAADGAFLSDGGFVPLPALPEALLAERFRGALLQFLAENHGECAHPPDVPPASRHRVAPREARGSPAPGPRLQRVSLRWA
jgi:hypothetical protein